MDAKRGANEQGKQKQGWVDDAKRGENQQQSDDLMQQLRPGLWPSPNLDPKQDSNVLQSRVAQE